MYKVNFKGSKEINGKIYFKTYKMQLKTTSRTVIYMCMYVGYVGIEAGEFQKKSLK